jgi:aspartyl-tRNA(Asn)/glutamyl-tRNA(Gln) amidotransferase subunit A
VLARTCYVVEDVAFPAMPFGPVVHMVVVAEGACALRTLIENGQMRELRTASMHPAAVAASVAPAVDYLQAMRLRTRMRRVLHELYAKYDALVAPSRGTVAHPLDRNFNEAYANFRQGPPIIPAGNIAGQPALSVPSGFGPDGLPTGIQFTGKAWSEARLISIASAYQSATEWHRRRPNLPRD